MDEGESGDEPAPMIVGTVNLAASVDNDVLRHLHSASEYLYVSGMAVDMNYRSDIAFHEFSQLFDYS